MPELNRDRDRVHTFEQGAPAPNLSSTLSLPSTLISESTRPTRAPSWLRRSSITVDSLLKRDSFDSGEENDYIPRPQYASIEETLKLQLCVVEAWKPMPNYFQSASVIVASEGEIVDPFRKDPPSPTGSVGKPSNAFFMSRPLSSEVGFQ